MRALLRWTTWSTSSSAAASTSSGSTTRWFAAGAKNDCGGGHPSRRGSPRDVRPDRAGLRPDEPGHERGARRALAEGDRRGGRFGGGHGSRCVLRDRRPRTRGLAGRWGRDWARLLGADARAGAAEGEPDRVDSGRRFGAALRGGLVRRGHGRVRRAQPRGSRARPGRARAGAAAGREARRAGDYAAQRRTRALLRRLVLPGRTGARETAPWRKGVHLPARQREAFSRTRRPGRPPARGGLLRRPVSPLPGG